MTELLKPFAIVLFVLSFVVLFILWRVRETRRQDKEQERNAKLIEQGIKDGKLTKDGQPACVVCGAAAAHLLLKTGRTWMETAWGLRTLNRLYAMPWRYRIEDDWEGGPMLCTAHRRVAEQKLEQIHAKWRAEHSEFNAKQQQKIAALEQGGLVQIIIEDTEAIQQSIGLRGAMRRTLDSQVRMLKNTEEVHVLQSESTDVSIRDQEPNE